MPRELDTGQNYTLALRPGTVLDGTFKVVRVLADTSSFAITYLAHGERAGEQVIIKELLPRTLAGRARDEISVRPHSAADETNLARTLRRFVREAELLADIAHPNIPRVRRCFEANGTAYVAFQHYEGKTLSDVAAASEGRLRADRAAGLVIQILQGIEALHAEGIIHGFITPDNILVDDNSRVLVLGLGTTRHVTGAAREPAAGFAPIEQYAAKEVGPWTDVYACAAVLYRLTTGVTPPSAIERSTGHGLPMPWATAEVPAPLGHTMMSALAQLPDARPHSAEELRRRIESSLAPASRTLSRADRLGPAEPRGANGRWLAPESSPPPLVAAIEQAAREDEESRIDYDALLDSAAQPTDRVRRLFRMVLGVGGATAALLLAVSLLGSRGNDTLVSGDVVAEAAPAAPAPRRRAPNVRSGDVAPPVRIDPANSVPERRVTRTATSDAVLRQAGATASRSTQPVAEPTSRSRAVTPARSTPPAVSSTANDPGQGRPSSDAPSITVSVPATIGQVELLPSEIVSGLRERLAHGKENMESGEYARAQQIYRAALDQIGALTERYSSAQVLLSLKADIERASDRALAACVAENEVAGRRNARPVKCQ